ncbi:MAG: hypothetical protein AAF748_07965 [Pseudomonadota bacterium]
MRHYTLTVFIWTATVFAAAALPTHADGRLAGNILPKEAAALQRRVRHNTKQG